MANSGSYWLESCTFPLASRVHGILGERTFKQEAGINSISCLGAWCSLLTLALALGCLLSLGSWCFWLGTFGCRCTQMLWVSGPCSLHRREYLWYWQMPGLSWAQATRGRKPAPGGRVACWDVRLTGLQPLGHYDPVQCGTWVLDCHTETDKGAPQTLREGAAARW